MNRLELLQLLSERRERHRKMVENGHPALEAYVNADRRLIERIQVMPEYIPGTCAQCGALLSEKRVRALAIDCVPCVDGGSATNEGIFSPERRRAIVVEFVREQNPTRAQQLWAAIIGDYLARIGNSELAAQWADLSFLDQETIMVAEMEELSYGVLRRGICHEVETALSRLTPIAVSS